MDGSAARVDATSTHLASLSFGELKAELVRLERSLQDSLMIKGSALKTATLQIISNLHSEMMGRKSSGQHLDQALAKEKTARQARKAAAPHTQGLESSLEIAERTFQEAKEEEDSAAAAETTRIQARLAEIGVPALCHSPSRHRPSMWKLLLPSLASCTSRAYCCHHDHWPSLQPGSIVDLPPMPPFPVPHLSLLPATAPLAAGPAEGLGLQDGHSGPSDGEERAGPSPGLLVVRSKRTASRGTAHTAKTVI